MVKELFRDILSGHQITKEEALELVNAPLDVLCEASDELRKKCCGDYFHLCSIINGKSGRCTENCAFCAQSSHYYTKVEEYPILSKERIAIDAGYNSGQKLDRFAVVTSGRKLFGKDFDELCVTFHELHQKYDIKLCASLGLLDYEQMVRLKEAGVTRYHNNLETSRNYFPFICTTHTYDEKIATINSALKAGLNVCSGGIIGMGETMTDRIDMVMTARELGVDSVPVNVLQAIPGTPFENMPSLELDEVRRTIAIFRFIMPYAYIRMAGGRMLLSDKGRAVFQSGVNAAISGDMLTYAGINTAYDRKMATEIGCVIRN